MFPRARRLAIGAIGAGWAFGALVALGAVLPLGARGGGASAATIQGVVVDHDGKPVPFATVSLPALRRGASAGEDGRFTIVAPDERVTLEVQQIGYQRAHVTVDASANAPQLRIVLADEPVPVSEVNVSASTFGKAGSSEGAVINRMDIYTTPGGAADVFQSLRALPGINAPNEGAALYVRGGDPKETLIRIDDAEIGHPYQYESASGGLFAGFDTYLLKSALFSSGGFSAKYGGVLSGVLDIETQDPLSTRSVSVGANMVGGSVQTSWALVPERWSVIGAAALSTPELLFRLYGSSSEFESAPSSGHGALKSVWRYAPTGRVTATYVGSGDDVAVRAFRFNYADTYRSRARNHFLAVQAQQLVGTKLTLQGVLSGQRYRSSWSYAAFSGVREEQNADARVTGLWVPSGRHAVSFGTEWRGRNADLTGPGAADSTDYAPGAPTRAYETRARLDLPGTYLEDKLRVVGPVYATIGGRLDRISTTGAWTVDPRASLAWRIDPYQTVRVAAGGYHQAPDPALLDPRYGNPSLGPLAATHWIAGYEYLTTDVNARVEAYRKTYRALVVTDSSAFYANGGTGYAQGVDVFLRGSHRSLTGWLSYGFLDSKRREYDDPRELPSGYSVRHTLTLVSEYAITPQWHTGARYSASSGRPYTPVVGRVYDSTRDLWRPVEGENNSALMPAFHRLDVRLTHLFSMPAIAKLPESSVCVAYVEALNVLGIRNTLQYHYTPDYSGRVAEDSYFSRRMLVAGVSLAW